MAGGGVGEAMLIGAAVGGASSAARGGNVLEGALLGGAMGGIGSGVAGAFGSAGSEVASQAAQQAATQAGTQAATQAGTQAATQAGTQAATQAATQAGTQAGAQAAGSGLSATTPTVGMKPLDFMSAPQVTGASGMDYGLTNTGASVGDYTLAPAARAADSTALATQMGTAAHPAEVAPAAQPSMMDKAMNWASKNPIPAATGAVGLASLLGGQKPASLESEKDKYKSTADLSKFRPSWPNYAEGGVAALNPDNSLMVGGGVNYNTKFAAGGISSLGSYSDGGRTLKGPGDGMSDSIPATISGKQPARLADGEFVVPADVVSHLGNGSTDAGAKQLYSMMDKVRRARTGNKKQGRQINPNRFVPA